MKSRNSKFISLALSLLLVLPIFVEAQNRRVSRKEKVAEISQIESHTKEIDRYIKTNPESFRIFANIASGVEKVADEWREFRSESEREAADTGDNLNENAYVWLKKGKVIGAKFTFQSPSRDWAHLVMYYFREDGSLAKVEAQLNTFYGNMSIIRERWYNREGKLLRSISRHLDLNSGKRRKPGKDFIDEPIPLYRSAENLPFHHLL